MKILGQNLELFSIPEGSIFTGSKSGRYSVEFLMEFQNRLILKKSLKVTSTRNVSTVDIQGNEKQKVVISSQSFVSVILVVWSVKSFSAWCC